MFAWFAENAGTIVVSIILLLILSAAVMKIAKDRKKGKHSCGCANCSMQCCSRHSAGER